jgi:predicted RNA methylase
MADPSDAAFVPASADLPSYFIPMLSDIERNRCYERAIQQSIASFVTAEGRAPRVLDVGAGTGMLSAMALKHGAACVMALEANETIAALGEAQLEASFPNGHWRVGCGLSLNLEKPSQEEGGPFDMLICELLGTMIHSESMYAYVWDLLMRGVVRHFGDRTAPRFYVVPQAATMTIAPYSCQAATGIPTGIDYVDMSPIFAAVYGSPAASLSRKLDWTQDEAQRIMLATAERKRLAEPVTVLEERYTMVSGGVQYRPSFSVQLPAGTDPNDVVLIAEWTCQLADGVELDHTLAGVAKLPDATRIARWINWGHVFAPLGRAVEGRSRSDKYTFRVNYRPADLDVVAEPVDVAVSTDAAASKRAKAQDGTGVKGAGDGATSSAASEGNTAPSSAGKRRIAPQAVVSEAPKAEEEAEEAEADFVPLSHKDLSRIVILSKAMAAEGYTSV